MLKTLYVLSVAAFSIYYDFNLRECSISSVAIFVSQHSQFECLKYIVYRNWGWVTTMVNFAFSMWAVEELLKHTGML